MDTIIEKIRNLIEDILITTGRDVFQYESITSSKIFTLTESNISVSTIIVYKNGIVWAGTNYSYSTTTGKLTVTGTLVVGDSLEIIYSYYAKYSDNELRGWIRATLSYISVEKYRTFVAKSDNIIFPTPSEPESNLIAVIAAILIKGDIRQYRTPEITINFEPSESKEKKIRRAVRQFKTSYGILDYVQMDKKIVEVVDQDI